MGVQAHVRFGVGACEGPELEIKCCFGELGNLILVDDLATVPSSPSLKVGLVVGSGGRLVMQKSLALRWCFPWNHPVCVASFGVGESPV